VVLDEASAIKNHKSHTSLACRALEAKHHWAISGNGLNPPSPRIVANLFALLSLGTPIQNSLQEFYPCKSTNSELSICTDSS